MCEEWEIAKEALINLGWSQADLSDNLLHMTLDGILYQFKYDEKVGSVTHSSFTDKRGWFVHGEHPAEDFRIYYEKPSRDCG